jgi:hypothetical protein
MCTDVPVTSHRGGKSGQEAICPRRKSCSQEKIRPTTLLATGFSKWPGGQPTAVDAGQPRTSLVNPGRGRAGGGVAGICQRMKDEG